MSVLGIHLNLETLSRPEEPSLEEAVSRICLNQFEVLQEHRVSACQKVKKHLCANAVWASAIAIPTALAGGASWFYLSSRSLEDWTNIALEYPKTIAIGVASNFLPVVGSFFSPRIGSRLLMIGALTVATTLLLAQAKYFSDNTRREFEREEDLIEAAKRESRGTLLNTLTRLYQELGGELNERLETAGDVASLYRLKLATLDLENNLVTIRNHFKTIGISPAETNLILTPLQIALQNVKERPLQISRENGRELLTLQGEIPIRFLSQTAEESLERALHTPLSRRDICKSYARSLGAGALTFASLGLIAGRALYHNEPNAIPVTLSAIGALGIAAAAERAVRTRSQQKARTQSEGFQTEKRAALDELTTLYRDIGEGLGQELTRAQEASDLLQELQQTALQMEQKLPLILRQLKTAGISEEEAVAILAPLTRTLKTIEEARPIEPSPPPIEVPVLPPRAPSPAESEDRFVTPVPFVSPPPPPALRIPTPELVEPPIAPPAPPRSPTPPPQIAAPLPRKPSLLRPPVLDMPDSRIPTPASPEIAPLTPPLQNREPSPPLLPKTFGEKLRSALTRLATWIRSLMPTWLLQFFSR